MKHTKWIVTGMGAALMALVAGSFLAQQAKTPSLKEEVALRTAIEKEMVQGDPKGAIEQFKKLAQSNNPAIAAQALIHLGECYEKLGSNEASKQYALVISKFPDQKDAVAQARAHLGGITPRNHGLAERPVWEMPHDFGRAVSPDGRYIAFMDDSANLALHDLTTGADRRLTHEDKGIDEVAFSPDGKQIAYIAFTPQRRSELRVQNLSEAGQTTPRIYTHADWEFDTVSWSADGRWLASSAGPSGKPNQIVLVSVQDGSIRELKVTEPNSDHLDFSPDGKYLAYTRWNNLRSGDIFVLPTDGGNEIPVVDWPSNEYAIGWSPDGHLLFSSDRGGSMGLWALPFKDGKPRGAPAPVTSIGDGDPVGLTSSGALYYQIRSGDTLAYYQIAPFDWNTGRILSPTVTVGPVIRSSPASWSRDGKYFAYIKPVVGVDHPSGVTIRTTETGASRELGSDCLVRPLTVQWAPDGHTLATVGTDGLCLIDAQTGLVSKIETKLGPGESFVGAQWSPDQKKLYFRRLSRRSGGGDDSMAFIEKDLASGNQREIIRRPSSADLGGQVSPDGRFIGVVSQEVSTKSASVLLIPLAGGEPKELLRLPGQDLWSLNFSPDGKYIRTAGFAGNNWTPVWFIPTAGGEPQKWLNATEPLVVTGGFWSPDNKSVFLRKTTTTGEQTELWRVPVGGGQAVKMDINMNLDHNGTGPYVSPDGSQIAILREETTPRKNEIWVLENFLSSIPAGK